MPSLESIIADVNAAGYVVNNLFQIHDNNWQANVAHENRADGFEFGIGDTPAIALSLALAKAKRDYVPLVVRPAKVDLVVDVFA